MLSVEATRQHRSPGIITPIVPGRQGFVCPAQRMLEAGDEDAAERYVTRLRTVFAQQRCEPFQPLGDHGPWVVSAFCPTCESIRRDCTPDGFLSLPWAVDARNRAMPINGNGPLAPTRRYPRLDPLPTRWREQVAELAECIADQQFAETRQPVSVPIDLLVRNIANRTGRELSVGVMLLGFLQAGHSFGVTNDGGSVRITIGGSESLKAADAICRRLLAGSPAGNHSPLPNTPQPSHFDTITGDTSGEGDTRSGSSNSNVLPAQTEAGADPGRNLFPIAAAASIPPLAALAESGGER